ncbi:MAG: hypothetical protein NVS1B4_10520 [Gemmatimonadaceae bacterium]
MNRYRSIAVLLCVAGLSSCGKNAVQDITGALPRGRIKFFNYGVNAPAVNFYANATKMTAVSSTTGTESTTGTVYGGAGAGGYYTAIAPGAYTLSGKIAAATDKDLAVSRVAATLSDGKFYSFYQSGFYDPVAKSVDAFIVEDPFVPTVDYSVAYVRFVNAIGNANPMTLYAKNTTTTTEVAVGGDVAYKGAGVFTALPGGAYDLSARDAAAATPPITRAGVAFAAGRVYTIAARGDITVTSTSAANRPILDSTPNR